MASPMARQNAAIINGQLALKVVQNTPQPSTMITPWMKISGATLTSVGVAEKSINHWVGEQGCGNFLRQLQHNPEILRR